MIDDFLKCAGRTIIAIDPGASGAIVWIGDSLPVQAMEMPPTLRDIWDLLGDIKREAVTSNNSLFCAIEKVGTYMPGNSGPSAAKFAEHIGALKMALIGTGIRHEFILPNHWMTSLLGDAKPKGSDAASKRLRKNAIKAKMQEIFVDQKVTLTTADALGILYYALKKEV